MGLSKFKSIHRDDSLSSFESSDIVVPEKCPFCLNEFADASSNPSCPVCSGSSLASSIGPYYPADLKDPKRTSEKSYRQNSKSKNAKKAGGKQTFILFQQNYGKANYTPSVYPFACIIGSLTGLLLGVAVALGVSYFWGKSLFSFPEIKVYDPRLIATDYQSKVEFNVFNSSPNDFKDLSFSIALFDEYGQLLRIANFEAKELLYGRKFKKTNISTGRQVLKSLESARFEAVIDGLKASFASVKISGYSF